MGQVRYPRAWLVLGGRPVLCLQASAHVNRLSSSDTFNATLPMSALARAGLSVGYFVDTAPIEATLDMGLTADGSDRKTIVDGKLTSIEFDWAGGTLQISGRDNGAEALEKKSNEKFLNQKAEDIVRTIAGRHGLTVVTSGSSSTGKAGKLYGSDFAKLTDQMSETTLLQHLADREGKSWYVKAKKLYWIDGEDKSEGTLRVTYRPPSATDYASGNFLRLRHVRNVKLSGKATANVRSWNHKTKQAITSKKELEGKGEGVTYEYRLPNLTQDQADKIAEKRLSENTRHEISIEVEMPGDPTVDARMSLELNGTGTALDQTYAIDSIDHEMSADGGYRMSIRGKSAAKGRSSS